MTRAVRVIVLAVVLGVGIVACNRVVDLTPDASRTDAPGAPPDGGGPDGFFPDGAPLPDAAVLG